MPVLAPTKRTQGANIMHVLQSFEQGYKLHQVIIGWVTDPSLNGDCIVYSMSSQHKSNVRNFQQGNAPSWNR